MEKNMIAVTKTVTEEYAANTVKINFTVTGTDRNAGAAITAAEIKAAALTEAFKGIKGVCLAAGSSSLNEQRSEKKITGYRALRLYSAEFDHDKDKLEAVTNALAELDVEWRIAFLYKDNGERARLIERAVSEAKADALTLATAAGVKLGKLGCIDYASSGGHSMMYAARFAAQPEPERITVSETVMCGWEIV